MLAWRHSGFSVHNSVRVRAHDADGRKKLAQCMLRAPFSLEKMSYDPNSGTVIYRSRLHKGLKRNFQLMPGAQWLEMLCRHIPDRFEHLVRYFGWYSNRVRATRARSDTHSPVEQESQDRDAVAARARSSWARLIHKVYEVDPLQCPKCQGPMRVIALIEDAAVIRRILEHLGLWAPRHLVPKNARSAPVRQPDADAPTPTPNMCTYHPVPDIA
jgi:hypothetical protein